MINQKKNRKKLNVSTKHLAMLMGMAIILFAAIVVYFISAGDEGFSEYAKSQEALSLEEQAQLSDISEHLKGIDEIVLTNREQLSEVSLYNADTEKTLADFSEILSCLEKNVATIETNLKEYMEVSKNQNTTIHTALTAIFNRQQEIKEQIISTTETITALLADMKSENETKFSETFDKLEELQTTTDNIQKNVGAYHKDLVKVIGLFQSENQREHEELTEMLIAIADEMNTLINERFSAMQMQLEREYSSLIKHMDNLHKQIGSTEQSITALLWLMEERDENRQEEIREAFTAIVNSLEQINVDFNTAHSEIQGLITILQETGAANHEETLSVLNIMESNMTEGASHNLSQITNSLQSMADNFNTSISTMQNEMSQSFETLNNGIDNNFMQYNSFVSERLDQINNNITNQYDSLSTTVNNYGTDQQESYDNLLNAINKEFEKVFQFVSDGKKKLASALLTKSVIVREDATFQEIYQGILNIPQQLVIGVEKLPGEISYDYHYHVDKQGATPHTDTANESGGCYKNTLYHVHVGSTSKNGGCYTNPVYHSHTGSCYSEGNHNDSCPWHTEYHSYNCGTVHDWNGDGHGCDGFTEWDCGGHRYLSCNKPSITGYSLGCGMTTSTIIGYGASCGLSDGQIIGAHIVYVQGVQFMQADALLFTMDTISGRDTTEIPDVTEISVTAEDSPPIDEEHIDKFNPSVSDNTLISEE